MRLQEAYSKAYKLQRSNQPQKIIALLLLLEYPALSDDNVLIYNLIIV